MSISIRPPDSKTGSKRQPLQSSTVTLLLAAVILVAGWQVLGLPGHLVRKHIPPADQPWFPYGMRTVFLQGSGELIIKRKGYLDRIGTYIYKDSCRLLKLQDDDETYLEKDDTAGIFRGNRKRMKSRMALEINCSRQYFHWIAAVKQNAGNPRRVAEILASDGSEFFSGPQSQKEPHVRVSLYPGSEEVFPVLEGHQYFPVFDAAAFIEPHVWLTTDRATWLHQLWIHDLPDYGVTVLKSVPIENSLPQDTNSILGLDPESSRLFLLTSDGVRRWFDPRTLDHLDSDQLSGEWRREYGALSTRSEDYSFHTGIALSKAGYERLMRLLMVVFLTGLLWLSLYWSRRWMSMLDPTTADTKQNSS